MSISGNRAKLAKHLDKQEQRYSDSAITVPGLDDHNVRIGTNNYVQGGYPASYFEQNEHEKDMRLKQEYVQYLHNHNIPTKYTVEKADIDVMKQKSEEAELMQLDAFVQQLYNMNDPKDVKIMKELWPAYFERREKEIDKQIELQKRFAKIRMFGVQNTDDLLLLYGVSTGEVKMEPFAPWTGLRKNDPADQLSRFKRGYFSVHRMFVNGRGFSDATKHGQWRDAFNPLVDDSGVFQNDRSLINPTIANQIPRSDYPYTREPSNFGGLKASWLQNVENPTAARGQRIFTPLAYVR